MKCHVIASPSDNGDKIRGCAMDDKDPILKKVEDKIKDAAKAVEDFADEVAAPETPVVIIPDPDDPESDRKKGS